jgi:hypothetical protein
MNLIQFKKNKKMLKKAIENFCNDNKKIWEIALIKTVLINNNQILCMIMRLIQIILEKIFSMIKILKIL